ncbi:MAG: hypothetical protein M1834_001342 [Cirrosporium novae-zelandiae]|nr:MAG: hypothetical protein M1834_001342 [Cirrosporium novae-zelandiae]
MEFPGTDFDPSMRMLFRRCVQCPNTSPSCPSCDTDETCSLSVQTCKSCPSTSCVKSSILGSTTSSSSSSSNESSGPSKGQIAGAIAGGVIGGILVIGLITYFVWKFCIKNRRRQYEEQTTQWQDEGTEKDEFTMQRNARASTHTVASIASTVLTRASNIIQIAYIPGVTNRSPVSTPGLLVPPVPPLPAGTTASSLSTPNYQQDQHFFVPGNIRDSTWSGTTDDSYRNSIAPSLARSSVATTIYRNNAIISPVPATTALRGKAAVVSVKSSTSGSTTPTRPGTSSSDAPPVPAIAPQHSQMSLKNMNSPILAHAVSAKSVKVINRTPSGKTAKTKTSNLSLATSASDIPDPKDEASPSNKGKSPAKSLSSAAPDSGVSPVTIIEDSPATKQSPFSPISPSGDGPTMLPKILEEAVKRASMMGSSASERSYTIDKTKDDKDQGPFSDENEVKQS